MKLIYGLDKLPVAPGGRAVTVGTFDGVHLGHQQILRQLAAGAKERQLIATAVSFEPHPLAVLQPQAAPLQLSTIAERAEFMQSLGLAELVVLPFTRELAAMSPHAFARDVLAERLQARLVCEGWNFRFGQGGAGTPALLAEVGQQLGFAVEIVPPVQLDGHNVSSTLVRDWLLAGNVSGVWRALGRPYQVQGEVVRGDGRGRQLGFPTANIAVPAGRALPAPGVYVVGARVRQSDPWLPGMANFGWQPTFKGKTLRLEVHILEGRHDLYGATLAVAFVSRLRPVQAFAGPNDLVIQLNRDRTVAADVWQKKGHLL